MPDRRRNGWEKPGAETMTAFSTVVSRLGIAAVLALSAPAAGAGFVDVLDSPAQMSPLASRSLLQKVTKAGNRLVAVGQRGHVLTSTDGGATWKQSQVPVSADLTSVFFVDDKAGWAVGHDGVILHTADGGERWVVQLTGRDANKLLVAAIERKVAADPASDDAKKLLEEAKRYAEQGADKPFLDVWFADARTGYAVGAFNLVFRTSDGGRTWESWFDRTDNPKFFNLYAIVAAAGELYVAGEGGVVLKLDPAAQRFKALTTGYGGSFFGIADAGSAVLVFGLRGNVYRSEDGGRTWSKVDTGLAASVVSATRTARGTVLLADVAGRMAGSTDEGRTFAAMTLKRPMPLTSIADVGDGKVALAGPRGVAVSEALPH
jgi:photosystem II stability/assembly factor-like uncharacterized protein